MSISEKRMLITELSDHYPVTLLCKVLECPPSTYYYQAQPRQDDPQLVKRVEQLLALKPHLGYRMTIAYLQQSGLSAPERAIRRILRQFKGTKSVGRVVTTDSSHPHKRYPNAIRRLTAAYPDHIWVGDITFLRYGRQFFYLAVILDVYTRMVRGWQLEEFLTCEALTLPTLQMALRRGQPAFFHSDQGRQYAASDHVALLHAVGATVSMSDAGCPTQNAFVERFIRTLKEEHVFYHEYVSLADMRAQLRQFLEVEYNCERPHSSLGYMTPQQFERAYYWRNRCLSSH